MSNWYWLVAWKLKKQKDRQRKHILSISFLFPLVGLKDEPLRMGWDLLEPERSLVVGDGPDCNFVVAVPDFPGCDAVGMSLCKHIDNTTSTSGVGPGK